MANKEIDKLKVRIDRLDERMAALEEKLERQFISVRMYVGCDECGIVFVDREGYSEHLCPGKQGRRG